MKVDSSKDERGREREREGPQRVNKLQRNRPALYSKALQISVRPTLCIAGLRRYNAFTFYWAPERLGIFGIY